jgi:hypothetical protein
MINDVFNNLIVVVSHEIAANVIVRSLKMISTPFCASVLLITKRDPQINIAQILHLSNFFELKRIVYIHLQA